MTRGQRRAHGIAWLAIAIALALASVHALALRRAAWAEAEAIRDTPHPPAARGGTP